MNAVSLYNALRASARAARLSAERGSSPEQIEEDAMRAAGAYLQEEMHREYAPPTPPMSRPRGPRKVLINALAAAAAAWAFSAAPVGAAGECTRWHYEHAENLCSECRWATSEAVRRSETTDKAHKVRDLLRAIRDADRSCKRCHRERTLCEEAERARR